MIGHPKPPKKKKKALTATAEEKRYMTRVQELGCVVCSEFLELESEAEIHHILENRIYRNHSEVLPLCPMHHRLGGHGVAIHAGRAAWVDNFMSEREFEKIIKQLLNY